MRYIEEALRAHRTSLSLAAAALTVSLALVSCGGGGYGGGGMSAAVLPPTAFSLSMPANNAMTVGTTPTLTWTASLYATSYTVEVSTSNTFPLPLAATTTVAATSWTVTPALAAGTYFWRVVANNAYGMYTSATFSFTT